MNKKLLEKDSFLIGIFVLFFTLTYATDTQIYYTLSNLAVLHGLEVGGSSLAVIFLINYGNKKGFFK